jgi:hypothetical protein
VGRTVLPYRQVLEREYKPLEAILISILLEHHKALEELKAKCKGMEAAASKSAPPSAKDE